MAEFLGNIGGRKLHSVKFADGRCKLNSIKQESIIEFDTLEEGLNYPTPDRRVLTPCAICIPKYQKSISAKEEK